MMPDFKQKAEMINDILRRYLPPGGYTQNSLEDAMVYSVMSGGKRLRGIMLIEAFHLFCSDRDMEKMLAHPFAAAMEFIHAYSLVHDDLPSMDNDMYRRGVLTTHAKYGHAMGVLTGDALLNYAFETMTGTIPPLSKMRGEMAADLAVRAGRAMSVISEAAGYSGMIGGQVMDIYGTGSSAVSDDKDISPDRSSLTEILLKTYELKTSRLFQASLCAGAILGGADDSQVRSLREFGYYIGEAFQIRDDILDMTATFEQLGKDINSDSKNSKNTIASVLGIQKSQDLVLDYLDRALGELSLLPGDKVFFADLVEFLRSRVK